MISGPDLCCFQQDPDRYCRLFFTAFLRGLIPRRAAEFLAATGPHPRACSVASAVGAGNLIFAILTLSRSYGWPECRQGVLVGPGTSVSFLFFFVNLDPGANSPDYCPCEPVLGHPIRRVFWTS